MKYKYIYNDDTYNGNTFNFLPKKVLGIITSIKSQVKKSILDFQKLNRLTNYIHVNNSYVYKESNFLSAWQYDLSGAYNLFLSFFVNEKTTEKLLFYKNVKKYNINKIIGFALLGDYIKINSKGNKEFKINELRRCDLLTILYLC